MGGLCGWFFFMYRKFLFHFQQININSRREMTTKVLKFVTGNQNKLQEVRAILSPLFEVSSIVFLIGFPIGQYICVGIRHRPLRFLHAVSSSLYHFFIQMFQSKIHFEVLYFNVIFTNKLKFSKIKLILHFYVCETLLHNYTI